MLSDASAVVLFNALQQRQIDGLSLGDFQDVLHLSLRRYRLGDAVHSHNELSVPKALVENVDENLFAWAKFLGDGVGVEHLPHDAAISYALAELLEQLRHDDQCPFHAIQQVLFISDFKREVGTHALSSCPVIVVYLEMRDVCSMRRGLCLVTLDSYLELDQMLLSCVLLSHLQLYGECEAILFSYTYAYRVARCLQMPRLDIRLHLSEGESRDAP